MNYFVSGLLRNQTIRPFWQIFLYVLTLPFFFLGYFIPKNNEIWVFANTFGFKDNARYLFEYALDRHPEITPVWIAGWGRECVGTGRSYPRFSPRGLWFQYRAGIAFVSTGQGDLARFTLARTKIIQLWHGIPIKRILLNSLESLPFSNKSRILHAISLEIFKKSLRRYAAVIASSEKVQSRMASAFGLSKERVPVTGYPRHDIIFENAKKKEKIILYAPTWRSDIQNAFTIVHAICNLRFISKIEELGYELRVSIHPLNCELIRMLDREELASIKFIEDEDINIILAHSEILITDYSSIAIDFGMLGRKIIFYTPDACEFFESRGVYEEFESLILEQGVKTGDDILAHISGDKRINVPSFSEIFYQYHDAAARERIVALSKSMC